MRCYSNTPPPQGAVCLKENCPQTVQHVMRCYSNCGIMALLDVVTGAVFIVDVFNEGNIFLSLRIAHRSISPLTQQKTLYRPTLQFSLNTAYNSVSKPLKFSPLSAHNSVTNMA